MKISIEIEEGDDLGEVVNEVAGQLREESEADVVSIQLGLPGETYPAVARSPETTFREIIGTIEFSKQKMVQSHGRD